MYTRDGQEIIGWRTRNDGVRNLTGMLMPNSVFVKIADDTAVEYWHHAEYIRSFEVK